MFRDNEIIRFSIFSFVLTLISIYTGRLLSSWLDITVFNRKGSNDNLKKSQRSSGSIKVGLLTNELPPIVYGGVATWCTNFINMMVGNENIEIIPIFLAYNDSLSESDMEKYDKIRVIYTPADVNETFKDIDVCVNNLWVALETIIQIKEQYPELHMITVCHSLIRMEHITNLGSCYTNNFNDQEKTFEHSDTVVLISNAEEAYYNEFGYNKFPARTHVIYNSYIPKYDKRPFVANYDSNDVGYIGRHVPRKRAELGVKAVIDTLKNTSVKVYNMGVDYDKYDNEYWRKMATEYAKQLTVIPFSTDKKKKEQYWGDIGINAITGIYEPFGYTICEAIDRGVPVIVQNIDGPKEIVEGYEQFVYLYDVDIEDYDQDIINFSNTLNKLWGVSPAIRKYNATHARKALDKLRPEIIGAEWEKLIMDSIK